MCLWSHWSCVPGWDQDRKGRSKKKTGGLSHNTVLSFLLQDALLSAPKIYPSKWNSPHCAGQSWLDRPAGFQIRGEEWAVTKHAEEGKKKTGKGGRGRTANSTLRGWRKRYVLVKNKHVCCLSGALQQKGGEMSLFLLLFKLVAQKNNKSHSQATYWHRVPEWEYYRTKEQKKLFLLKVSLDNKQVRHLKVSSVSLWQVHCSTFRLKKTSPFCLSLTNGSKRLSVILGFSSLVWHLPLRNSCSSIWMFLGELFLGAGSVVSSSQIPLCVTVSVSDRSCASVDWSDAGIRTPVGVGALALLEESMSIRRVGQRVTGVVRIFWGAGEGGAKDWQGREERRIGKRESFSSWLAGFGDCAGSTSLRLCVAPPFYWVIWLSLSLV